MSYAEKPALIIVDMVKDYFDETLRLPVTQAARQIVPPLNRMIAEFRSRSWPIIFTTDAFHYEDFFFTSKMKPHAIAGTPGAEVIDELNRREEDYWLPKPRMSGFFKTGLEVWLKERGVTLCAVGGIATPFCVLTTVMDAVNHDFKTVLLEDCSAAGSQALHKNTLEIYRRNAIYPLLRVITYEEILLELQ